MSWTTAHFGVGMACSGAAALAVCAIRRRGWRWIGPVMTLGGVWAIMPDLPRLWRVDFPWLPLAGRLGDMRLERALHEWGNLFFFHRAMDGRPGEFALHGLALILLLYNLNIALLMWLEHRERHSPANRALRAHGAQLQRLMREGGDARQAPCIKDNSDDRHRAA